MLCRATPYRGFKSHRHRHELLQPNVDVVLEGGPQPLAGHVLPIKEVVEQLRERRSGLLAGFSEDRRGLAPHLLTAVPAALLTALSGRLTATPGQISLALLEDAFAVLESPPPHRQGLAHHLVRRGERLGIVERLPRALGARLKLAARKMLAAALGDRELHVVAGRRHVLAQLAMLPAEISGPLEEILLRQPTIRRDRRRARAPAATSHRNATSRRRCSPHRTRRRPLQRLLHELDRLGARTALAPIRIVLLEPLRIELQDQRPQRDRILPELAVLLPSARDHREPPIEIVERLVRRRPTIDRLGRAEPSAVVHKGVVQRLATGVDVRIPMREIEAGRRIRLAHHVPHEAALCASRRP